MKHDILTINEESLSIEVIAGKVNSSRFKNITKKGLRLFDQGKIYSTSFVGEISDSELLKKGEETKNKVGVGIPYDYELPSKNKLKNDEREGAAPLSSINEALEQTLEKLSPLFGEFVFNGKFIRTFQNVTLTNSEGIDLEMKTQFNDWHYLYKRIGSPQLFDGYISEESRDLHIEDVLLKNLPYLKMYKNEIKFEAGKYPVLFVDAGQLMGKLAESFIAEKYCMGSALYSGKLNQKIFSNDFSLFDVNYSPAHALYRKFDTEGTVRSISKLPLIENGVMKNIIADLRTAKKYGVEATGNGFRSTDSAVGTSFNRLVIGAGKRTTQEILNSLDNCVVVFMGHGGDFTDKGDFSTPLHLSYLVRKGEIAGRLPQLTVKTSTDQMFGSRLIEIASDGFQKSKLGPSLFCEMDVYLN